MNKEPHQFLWFSYGPDSRMLLLSVISCMEFFAKVGDRFSVLEEVGNPVHNSVKDRLKDLGVSFETREPHSNLQGDRHFIQGQIEFYLRYGKGCDFLWKVDSDVIFLDGAFKKHYLRRNSFCGAKQYLADGGHFIRGFFYGLDAGRIEDMLNYVKANPSDLVHEDVAICDIMRKTGMKFNEFPEAGVRLVLDRGMYDTPGIFESASVVGCGIKAVTKGSKVLPLELMEHLYKYKKKKRKDLNND